MGPEYGSLGLRSPQAFAARPPRQQPRNKKPRTSATALRSRTSHRSNTAGTARDGRRRSQEPWQPKSAGHAHEAAPLDLHRAHILAAFSRPRPRSARPAAGLLLSCLDFPANCLKLFVCRGARSPRQSVLRCSWAPRPAGK